MIVNSIQTPPLSGSGTGNVAENRFRSLLMQVPFAIGIFRGADFIVEFANSKMLELWGKTEEEVMNKPVFEVLPDASGQGYEQLLDGVFRTGVSFVAQEIPINLNRSVKKGQFVMKLIYEALREEDGRITGILALAEDITEQVQARTKVRESEARLKMAIQSTKLGTWDYNPITGELNWSDECRLIYGVGPDQTIDFTAFAEHIHPEDRLFAESEIAKSLNPQGKGDYDISFRILRFDNGETRWIRAQGKVYFNPQKEATRFIGTVIDISEQKEYENSLEQKVAERTQQLQKLNDELNMAQELARIGSWDWDISSNKITWSKNMFQLYGLNTSEEITFEKFKSFIHPEDRPLLDDTISVAFKIKAFPEFIHRIITAQGLSRLMHAKGEVKLDKEGNVIAMNVTEQDVT
ncbi:MAG TPA: PAS domain-containing protein [Bacteroidia bacterium]|jgi:PAS domain S-box-containing protein|nr:PAS domain-containing protein [Bacteroidia bacterium]